MALYSIETKHSSAEVMAQAEVFFGPGGVGLAMESRGDCCLYFEGGGGYVQISVPPSEGKITVEIETREWDYQARQFMAQIH
jgi:hypothetical protein